MPRPRKARASKVTARLPLVWDRLSREERRVLCELAGLPIGAVMVPASNLGEEHWRSVVLGMRRVVSLSLEIQFALGYWRSVPKGRELAPAARPDDDQT